MPNAAKVLSLRVRAKRNADHAFNSSGIVESVQPDLATLGAAVQAYDARAMLYPQLGRTVRDNTGADTGRLVYDSAALRRVLQPLSFCVLSNEVPAAELDQHILRRESVYLQRYQFIARMHEVVRDAYPAKVERLARLRALVEEHHQALDDRYAAGQDGVTSPKIVMATRIAGIGTFQRSETVVKEGGAEKQKHEQTVTSAIARFNGGKADAAPVYDPDAMTLSQETVSVSENDELRHPRLENTIRRDRVITDLSDEFLAESLFALGVPHLPRVWENELATLDLEIRKQQVLFIETFLVPRIDGTVAAVLKAPGENVRAGEPVVRVESDARLYLDARLKCASQVRLGQRCRVETTNVFESAPPTALALDAGVVAVHGYDAERDQWQVVLECANDGAVRLPVGYDFEPDADQTRVTFQ
jgi:hypothetical protein